MSTALRIASVTHCLRELLRNALETSRVSDIVEGDFILSAFPPDRIDVTGDKEVSQLNLFMYQVTYNQGWRNIGQPSVNSRGERVSSPPLAIDLHYLLTAYGKQDQDANILLGYAMQVFHETPVLERNIIGTLFNMGTLPASYNKFSTSFLAEQLEQIKITPELLSIEDVSKLWAAFGAKYRTTVAYKVTVVLIESEKSTKPALPVIERKIYVNPFNQPVIEKILSKENDAAETKEDQKILTGYTIILKGTQLPAKNVEIDIDDDPDMKIINAKVTTSGDQLSFIVTDKLKAGSHTLKVVHPTDMGSPPDDHAGVKSAGVGFMLSPSIVVNPATDKTGSGDFISATINLSVTPGLHPEQNITLFMNEITDAEDAKSYSFKNLPLVLASPPEIENIGIRITNVKKSKYLLRLSVDGADSPLVSVDGKFANPKIDLS